MGRIHVLSVAIAAVSISMAVGGAFAQPAQAGASAGQTVILQRAPTDQTVAIPKETLARYFADMDARKLQTLRMLEGGKYNVNIRRITNAKTALVHPTTIDLWVVLEGSGTLTAGARFRTGRSSVGSRTRSGRATWSSSLPRCRTA
jgi:hypothetical protein